MPVNLKAKKRLVSRIVGVGVNRVRLDNDHLDDVAAVSYTHLTLPTILLV